MRPPRLLYTARCVRAALRPLPLPAPPLRRSSDTKGEPPPESPPPTQLEYTSRYKYHPEIEVLVNMQIQCENQAAQDYLGMAVYFAHPDVSRPGCHQFFMRLYEEELGHMLAFVRYQLTRGGVVQIGSLAAPPQNDKLDIPDAFRRALCMEHLVTEKLEKIVIEAESGKDYQCAEFVTSTFLTEQVRSLQEIAGHVTRLSRLVCCPSALEKYDQELARQYPYTACTRTYKKT